MAAWLFTLDMRVGMAYNPPGGQRDIGATLFRPPETPENWPNERFSIPEVTLYQPGTFRINLRNGIEGQAR